MRPQINNKQFDEERALYNLKTSEQAVSDIAALQIV